MRLFHVSEQPDIQVFQPRIPTRKELDQTTGLVWAMDEAHLPNYLTPRECPRVTYHVGNHTTPEDRKRFFTSSGLSYGLVLEGRWLPAMERTTLYLYEFDPRDFVLQDAVAGYYVAKTTQIPLRRCALTGLFQELVAGGYFLCDSLLYGMGGALASVPANLIQGASGLVLAVVLYRALVAVPDLKKLIS